MKTKKEEVEDTNLIVIADKDVSVYAWVLLLAVQPLSYNKEGCIKIQAARTRLERAETLIRLFKACGLEEVDRKQHTIRVNPPTGRAYDLTDAYEITLKKHPALLDW